MPGRDFFWQAVRWENFANIPKLIFEMADIKMKKNVFVVFENIRV